MTGITNHGGHMGKKLALSIITSVAAMAIYELVIKPRLAPKPSTEGVFYA